MWFRKKCEEEVSMGAAGGSGGKRGRGGYEESFSHINSSPKKDLARILIEGTNTVYGSERGERVRTEFERLEKQPVYRRSAEESAQD